MGETRKLRMTAIARNGTIQRENGVVKQNSTQFNFIFVQWVLRKIVDWFGPIGWNLNRILLKNAKCHEHPAHHYNHYKFPFHFEEILNN